LVTSLREVF